MNLHKKIKSIEFLPSEKIRSKIDIMKSLRDSFKSPEVLKLQAFKTYDKLAKQTEFYKLFSEKKTLNNNHEFILPPILKKKIEEKNYLIKKLMEKEGKDRKFFIKKYENNHEAIKINNNETTREKTYENQYKKILHKKSLSFKEMKNNLPLKYNVEKYLK